MKVERVCLCCERQFTARQADVNRGWARFCSKRCKAIKQEQQTGQHAAFLAGEAQRDHEYAMDSAESGWDGHKGYF